MNSDMKRILVVWAVGVFSAVSCAALSKISYDAFKQGVFDLGDAFDAACFMILVLCLLGVAIITFHVHLMMVLLALDIEKGVEA